MKKQIKSFKSSFKGMFSALAAEGHMRFHFIVAIYVFVFGCFYDFSAARWGVLALVCGLVISLEAVNTAVERLCDLICPRYSHAVGAIKDISSGAVLAASAAAVFVGVIFFWNVGVFRKIYRFFVLNPILLCLLLLSFAFSVLFVRNGIMLFGAFGKRRRNRQKNAETGRKNNSKTTVRGFDAVSSADEDPEDEVL